MARPMRDNANRGQARRMLNNRLAREEMGEEAYRKSLAPPDRTTKIALLLLVLVAGVIMFTLE